jgi:hypothetical protein
MHESLRSETDEIRCYLIVDLPFTFLHCNMLKLIIIVATNKKISPERNTTSATLSYAGLDVLLLRIERYESILLTINNRIAIAVHSSMYDASWYLLTLSDVSTTKQSPTSVDEAESICGKLLLFPDVIN